MRPAMLFLRELLNLRTDDPKAVERFLKSFRDWLPIWWEVFSAEARRRLEDYSPPPGLESYWSGRRRDRLDQMEPETVADQRVWVVRPLPEERLQDALAVRKRLQQVWGLPTPVLRELGVLDLLTLHLNPEGRTRLLRLSTQPPANPFEELLGEIPIRLYGSGTVQDLSSPSLGRFESALWYCMRSSDRLRVCPNPGCPAPYFVAGRRSQRYCSEACAGPSQREFKRRWWTEHGSQWIRRRKARTARAKKSQRKRGK